MPSAGQQLPIWTTDVTDGPLEAPLYCRSMVYYPTCSILVILLNSIIRPHSAQSSRLKRSRVNENNSGSFVHPPAFYEAYDGKR